MNDQDVELIYELSPMQQAMLFHTLYAPGSGIYVIQLSLRLTGRLDVDAFERAWRLLIARHDVLRTGFFWEDLEKPVQVVYREVPLEIERRSWRGLDAEEQRARLAAFVDADRERGFDLSAPPLMRLALLELDEDVQQLVWSQHHIAVDGWSRILLLQELFAAYAAFARGGTPDLPPARGFRDYIAWLQRRPEGEAEAFWRRGLAGFTTPTFMAGGDRRPAGATYRETRRRELPLPARTAGALRELARRRRLTLNTLAQGAWGLLVSRATGSPDVLFGATVAGRPTDLPGVESIVGLFINTLPVRLRVEPDRGLADWLAGLQQSQAELRRMEYSPLVDVQQWSELPAEAPLFDHILVFENLAAVPAEAAGQQSGLAIGETAAETVTNYPLNAVVVPEADGLALSILYDSDHFEAVEVARMLQHWAWWLEAMVEHPDARLGELPALPEAERHQLLAEWNDTRGPFPEATLLHQFFEAAADRSPAAVAAVCAGRELTYGELEARSNQLANLLRGTGVRRGAPVGVWVERSLDLVTSVLGILKAGGHYLALDSGWPAGRVESILAAAGAPALLAGRAQLAAAEEMSWRLPALSDVVCLGEAGPAPAPEEVDAATVRELWDYVAERAVDRVTAGGFVSAFTDRPFSEAEVDEYRDRVLALAGPWLRPGARVLEIGNGSGLLLWEIAPRVARITGVDPSPLTQERNRERAAREGRENVELLTGFAHEADGLLPAGERFDLVLLASTVQFFPGPRYLERVVDQALARLAPGGALLIADVLDARRRGELQREIEARREEAGLGPAPSRRRELFLDEDLFRDLGARPGVAATAVLHREAGFPNELRFRYDVLLTRPAAETAAGEVLQEARRKRLWTGWHVDRGPAGRPPAEAGPEDVAYVIHTSGSTGEPKGIVVQHRPAANLIDWMNRTFGVGPGDRVLLVASIAFDLSVYDIFGVLAAGGAVHLATEEEMADPDRLVALLRQGGITVWDSAPAALVRLAPLFPGEPDAGSRLRLVILSGDWIPVTLPDRVRGAFPAARVMALGGATEATVWSNWFPVREVDPAWPSIPYGRPIANARYHVLDAGFAPCPAGVPGDLYIGGDCLCVGYARRPDLTALAFLPDPFSGVPGARLYATGDRARHYPDGKLEFLGRLDQQVKVRGYRIELGEIEVALSRQPGVREAVVLAREDEPGDQRLVAYVVPAAGAALPAAELREALRRQLPEYMVPAAFVTLEALPVTANGKLDRQALPAPRWGSGSEGEGARTPVEEMLAGIWADILGASRIGREDSFFSLGGHSLLATQVVSRVRQTLGVELPLRVLFEAPTLAEMAREIDEARLGRTAAPAPPIVPVPRDGGGLPLSFGQRRLWLLDQIEPGDPAYNISWGARLAGDLDAGLLRRTFGEVVRRHEALRTTFAPGDGEAVQGVHESVEIPLPVISLEALPAAAAAAEVERIAAGEVLLRFDLARGPLLRLALLRLGPREHVLLASLHHIVSDGWSMGVLLREMMTLYGAFARGEGSPLPELPVQYADFAVWQREWLRGEVLEAQLAYWREQLAGAPPRLELPTDRPRPEAGVHRGGVCWAALDAELSREVAAFSRQEGMTPFMTLLAVYGLLLGRLAHQRDVLVGSPIANRNRHEVEDLIGFFINTLVLRIRSAGAPSFRELLGRTRQAALDAYAHQDLPFERLVEELVPERSRSHSPVFQVMFAFQNNPVVPLAVPGLEMTPLRMGRTVAQFDLSLTFAETPEGLAGGLAYDAEIFDLATAERLLARFEQLLRAGLADPDRGVEELPLLLPGEREQIVHEWNDTAVRYPGAESTLHELVSARAAASPGAVAVSSEEASLTYAELEERSNRLARFLRRLGVGPESRVGIAVERSPDLAVAVLGALKAGGAYLPLDPEAPRDRLEAMLEDGDARVVISRQGLAAALPEGDYERVWLDADAGRIAGESAAPVAAGTDGDHLAYVIYTSGSTGRPKGVMVSHRSILNRLLWMQDRFPLNVADVLLQKTPLTFDASVWELFVPLFAGARLEMARPGGHRDSEYLVQRVKEAGVTVLQLVPSQLRVFLDQPGVEGCASLRRLFCGGEALPESLRERAFELLGIAEMCNLYGPTEASIDASFQECLPGEHVPGGMVPIGRPLGNLRLFVLDEELELAPVGVSGELYIGGVNLARGYAGRPDLTADRFVPDGSSGLPGERLYRTGDRARHLADGRIEYMGRLDNQVKIRGVRIEPGEIESLLRRHPGVGEAVVVVREDTPGDRRLVAYLEGEAVPAAGELRAYLQQSLPEVMIPTAFVTLAKLPQLPNGKLDRGALPDPSAVPAAAGEEPAAPAGRAPQTPVEELVAQAWREVLGLERVGAEESFFELGGHSLLVFQVVTRLRETFKVKVPLRVLFNAPTVADLAAEIEKLLRAGGGLEAPPVEPAPRTGPLPPSFAQQRLWLIDQLAPGGAAYNLPAAVRLAGEISPALLRRVFAEVVRRHEALRTTFAAPEGRPVQVIAPPSVPALPVVDLSALPEARREAAARDLALKEARRPFDLESGPLLRLGLVRLAALDHLLLMTMHHIVSDGWSTGVLLRELGALHAAFSQGLPSPLPELPVQYADFALWQRSWLQGEVLEGQIAYWRRQLEGAPRVLELPTDRPRRLVATRPGVSLPLALSTALSERVRDLGLQQGVTPFMTLLAAWSALLGRLSGQEDVLVGSPVAGRNRREVEDLIGFFVNSLVLRSRLAGSPAFGELLGRVREAALDAYTHQDLPFERLVEEVEAGRDLAVSPLFQTLFVLQNPAGGALSVPGLTLTPLVVDSGVAKVDLTLTLIDRGPRGFAGALEYDAGLFDPATAARLAGRFEALLEAAVGDPGRPLAELPAMLPAERHQALAEWNDTARSYVTGVTLHELVARQAARTPEAVASSFEGEALSYRELERRANRLARHLIALGVEPDGRVGVLMERSNEMIVALLGILKAGAGYVPLDPTYPAERLALLAEGSGARAVIAQERLTPLLPGYAGSMVLLDRGWQGDGDDAAPAVRTDEENLAYALFTSGSTGTPKGVMIPHRGIVNRLLWMQEAYGLTPADRVLQKTPFSFDVSLWEFFWPLITGARLVFAKPEGHRDPAYLADLIAREGITTLHFVPSMLQAFLEEPAVSGLPSLRRVMASGEALPPELVRRFYSRITGAGLHNLYGPTEASVDASFWPCDPDPARSVVPIGRPIANLRLHVVDRELHPQPVGVAGELLLGGVGLARGYLGRPDLTAAAFVPDPFGEEAGGRLYRTGDLVRTLPDGNVEFLGRIDHQVKIRGFRIELGEIEAVLAAVPGVREAVVMVRSDGSDRSDRSDRSPGDRRLVAYVTGGTEVEQLRKALSERLPEYMVPAVFVVLEALPLSPNGKVDRKALPAPEASRPTTEYVAPEGPVAETVAEVWAEVLGLERVGARDNFFDLGGHSLLATQVSVQIWKRLDVRLPLREMFLHPTVESLAARLEQEMLDRAGDGLLDLIEGMDEEEAARLLGSEVES